MRFEAEPSCLSYRLSELRLISIGGISTEALLSCKMLFRIPASGAPRTHQVTAVSDANDIDEIETLSCHTSTMRNTAHAENLFNMTIFDRNHLLSHFGLLVATRWFCSLRRFKITNRLRLWKPKESIVTVP